MTHDASALGELALGHAFVAFPGLVEAVRRSKTRVRRNFCNWKKIQLFRSPVSPSGMRRIPAGIRAATSRMTVSASARVTLPLR